MATANFNIQPQDGWVEITSAGVDFIRIHQYPETQPFYVTTGSSTPAATVRGYRVDYAEFWCNVPVADKFYVRTTNPKPDLPLRIDVFYVLT